MSDESLRSAGRAELDRLNAGAKKPTTKKKSRHAASGLGDLVGIGKAKQPMHRGESVDDVVKRAVDGAPKP